MMPGDIHSGPYPDPARVGDALITDRVLEAAKPVADRVKDLENRVREKVSILDAELRSRIACEILGPLQDVPPSMWALTVLAERVSEATDPMAIVLAVETFSRHLSQLCSTNQGKADLVQALVTLGKLQRVPR